MNILGKLFSTLLYINFLQIHIFYQIRAPKTLIAFLQFLFKTFFIIYLNQKIQKKRKKTHESENSKFCKIWLSTIGGRGHFDTGDKCFQTSFRMIAKLGTHISRNLKFGAWQKPLPRGLHNTKVLRKKEPDFNSFKRVLKYSSLNRLITHTKVQARKRSC